MRLRRLLWVPAVALVVLVAAAGPASASESVGACIVEELEAAEEEAGVLLPEFGDEQLEKFEEKAEECLEAPNPILPELSEIIWGGLAFLVLLGVMVKWGVPAIKGIMDERADKIRTDLDEAEKARTEAETVKADYEAELADAKAEAARIIDEARQTAESVRSDLRSRADAEIAEMRERAAADVEAAKAQAVSDLTADVSGLAIGAAELVVERNLDRDTQTQLIENYIEEVSRR